MDAARLNDEAFDSGAWLSLIERYLHTIKTAILATFSYFCLPLATVTELLISLIEEYVSMLALGILTNPIIFVRVTSGVQVCGRNIFRHGA
jgi:hypothetical protein